MSELFPPRLDDLIACVDREIDMRARVYPRQVAAGRLTQARAERELLLMRAVRDKLMELSNAAE